MKSLVISDEYPNNNRWSTGEIISPTLVWTCLQTRLIDYWQLKRLRIAKINEYEVVPLLSFLGNGLAIHLEQLEIDRITLRQRESLTCGFSHLRLLSIGSIVLNDLLGERLPEEQPENSSFPAFIEFHTPVLQKVYLGKWSDCSIVTLLVRHF